MNLVSCYLGLPGYVFISSKRSLLCSSVYILSLYPSIASCLFLRLIIRQRFLLSFQMLYLISAGLNLLYSSYLYLSSFIIIFSRPFISTARLLRCAPDIHPHLNTPATRNASENSTACVRGRWQHYKSGSRTFCRAVMQKKSANC